MSTATASPSARRVAPPAPTEAHLRAEMLLDVCVALGAISELEPLLAFIIDTAAEVTDCVAASVLLFEESSGRLRFVAATGADPETLARIPVPITGSIAGTIYAENRAVVVDDTAQDGRHYEVVGEAVSLKTERLVGVPLRIDGKPIGVLEVLNPRRGHFAGHEVETLTIVAAQAAVAVRNAKQQAALRSSYEALNRLDQMKSAFMTIASHELRTPLTAILGFAALIEEEAEGPLTEFARAVSTAAMQAQGVVGTMEMLGRLDDELPAAHDRVVMQHVVHHTVEAVRGQRPDKRIEWLIAMRPEPSWVRADAVSLGRALHAVLDNAVAFAPDSSEIHITLEVDIDDLALTVRDQGPGIEAGECERIFSPFYQVADPDTREHEGAGLGLTVARRLIEGMGGTLVAESEGLGEGSTFRFRLPTLSDAV